MKKFVYSFNEGSKDMKDLLGGKGANLAEMTKIGLPVPFGFTVTTEACNRYYDEGKTIGDDIVASIFEKLEELENTTGKKFGDVENPLLVSVRSGAEDLHAWHDGHHPEPGSERPDGRRTGCTDRKSAFRI